MPYIIDPNCIGEMDGSCVDVCPVDCIYEGETKRYINPTECIECGACTTACPVSAILAPSDQSDPTWVVDNAAFFSEVLPGRDAPIGDPGGASLVGPFGVDTPLVSSMGGNG
jgi:NAD-dependent dihydropyrimidine dehydrogenase PreA subunit